MALKLNNPLKTLVATKFASAKQGNHLIFSGTQVASIRSSSGVPFQLLYLPTLTKKPKPSTKDGGSEKSKFDPFEKPSEELLVCEVPMSNPTHVVVLNKYPVIVNHFILATKVNKPQTEILEHDDLYLSYSCVRDWQEGSQSSDGQSLFAFFNSGVNSGASQAHRHLQFLPIEAMREQFKGPWEPLVESMITPTEDASTFVRNDKLPFEHFAVKLPQSVSSDSLYKSYLLLLKRAWVASQHSQLDLDSVRIQDFTQDGQVTLSYNLAMTLEVLAIIPRRSEDSAVPGIPGSAIGVNGTILGGTLMVKSEEEWHVLRNEPTTLDTVLTDVGFPTKAKASL